MAQMKVAYLQGKKYEVIIGKSGWVDLFCDGSFIGKFIDFEESRRVIWNYWTKQGIDMPYLEADDFDVANEDE